MVNEYLAAHHNSMFEIFVFSLPGIMPPAKRRNIGASNHNARRMAERRARLTQEQRDEVNEQLRARMSRQRSTQSQEQQRDNRFRQQHNRELHSLQINANRRVSRRSMNVQLERAAFQYDSTIDYSGLPCMQIGEMNVICEHCNAMKFRTEAPGLCCASGKVKLPPLPDPPETLRALLYDDTPQSRLFLRDPQKYNGCFQMTSFGANIDDERGFNPTFKVTSTCTTPYWIDQKHSSHLHLSPSVQIHGQIYHRVGSLLPLPNEDHKFLQIFFVGDSDQEATRRCAIFNALNREIVNNLQTMLHEHNLLVRVFKTKMEEMHSDDHMIVIRPEKRPAGTHARQYNAPTVDEVAVLIVGDITDHRDIIIKRRTDEHLRNVTETHRSYDALQYPVMFWRGDDGYQINIKMVNPTTG